MRVYSRAGNYIGEFDIEPGADLCEANLHGADLLEADLLEADLRCADLRWADLREADLRGTSLSGAKHSWDSHDLLAEILGREAGEDAAKLELVETILGSRDKCWDYWKALNHPKRVWAINTLRQWEGCPL